MIHTLKIDPPYFEAVANGSKPFELRREDDKTFAVGDFLRLREYHTPDGYIRLIKSYRDDHAVSLLDAMAAVQELGYTGRECTVEVTYVLRDEQWLQPGVAALGIQLINEGGED